MGVPEAGKWREKHNSDNEKYGGTGDYMNGQLETVEGECNGRPQYLEFNLPPLSVVIIEKVKTRKKKK
jgi:1,4-alpha-glucan branching enzyme